MGKFVLLPMAGIFFIVWAVSMVVYEVLKIAFTVAAFVIMFLLVGITGIGGSDL